MIRVHGEWVNCTGGRAKFSLLAANFISFPYVFKTLITFPHSHESFPENPPPLHTLVKCRVVEASLVNSKSFSG
ncbi:hypothetical protein POVCU2_0075110 [Plasmodium ovale curtisi]|uniref:Uncharacterized protein n=1 Tax=Plasmodium ovale curtisi TaxID=864141 RepID=A0A1A8WI43_PLAOA|nr:hypothetical protein POVCU2_0075110 [Plasmodium ovale curtisi]SBS99792.1 hypothetical protein POVCU1_055080 [Plasmodium ovale curtisi]